MFIYKADMYNDVISEESDVAELIIAKHRNGPLGTVKLRWNGETTSFLDYNKNFVKKKAQPQTDEELVAKEVDEAEFNEIKELFD